MPVLPITSEATLRACRAMAVSRQRDVFVCSYPKSGTTWTQNIAVRLLWDLAHRGKSDNSDDDDDGDGNGPQAPLPGDWHLSESAPFYEVDQYWKPGEDPGSGPMVRLPAETPILAGTADGDEEEYRVFNTHLLPHQLPAGAKCVYVVRDPLDVMVSFYHHLSNQAVEDGGYTGSFEDFFEAFLDGTIVYGKWQDHVEAWLGNRDPDDDYDDDDDDDDAFLLLHYDEMKRDLFGETKRLARFLFGETDGADDDRILDEIVEGVVPHCTFEAMKRERARYTPRTVSWRVRPETGRPYDAFVRRGAVGDGRRSLEEETNSSSSSSVSPLLDRWRNHDLPIARARWTRAGVDPGIRDKYLGRPDGDGTTAGDDVDDGEPR